MLQLRLTGPQRSALEARDIALGEITCRAWDGRLRLSWSAEETAALLDEMTEACNCEDAQAEMGDRHARRAATCLANICNSIIAAARAAS